MRQYYLDPHVTSANRLPARSRRKENCTLMTLDGEWSFRLFRTPEESEGYELPNADVSGFRPICVPGNWELQGFGAPIYTNYVYPWPLEGENGIDGLPKAWHVPADNPTGLYRKTILLDEYDSADRLVLRFEGVETAYELWINGSFAGYGEDSKLSGEFDVTGLLIPGENLIALRVFSFATSSYLEDQDYWYLCGIHRPAVLLREPDRRIEDVCLQPIPDRHGPGGLLRAEVKLPMQAGYAGWSVRLRLFDPQDVPVGETTVPVQRESEYTTRTVPAAATARAELRLDTVDLWWPESPLLYRAELDLLDARGTLCDREILRTGFKRVEIEDGILLLNGKRALIFGTNRHEHSWKEGRAVSRDHMIREITEMKRMNINAVRTCHYPDSPLWYDLCDEMGLLVLCECDLETHGLSGRISHDPDAAPVYVERAMRMVLQHRNHVCIYGWSLGNESGFGPGHAAMYGLIRELDPTRLCQYEAGDPGKNISQIRGKMYATEQEILGMLTHPTDDRPVILVEYLYQIRNSGGGMRKFIDLTRRYPRFQGGFVWDWQDKVLPGTAEDGTEFFAHGGDLSDRFLEPKEPLYMTNNGLVRGDLTWKPVAYEVREAYAPLLIEPLSSDNAWLQLAGKGRYRVLNRSMSRSSDTFRLSVTLMDGECTALDRWEQPLPMLNPGEETVLDLNSRLDTVSRAKGLFLCFTVLDRETGAERSCRQYRIADRLMPLPLPCEGTAPHARKGKDGVTVTWENGSALIDAQSGVLRSLIRGDSSVITGGCVTTDRPYCGLDAEPGWGWRTVMDEGRMIRPVCSSLSILRGSSSVEVIALLNADSLHCTLRWTFTGNGEIRCMMNAAAAYGLCLPRLGLELTLAPGFDKTEYIGYGPMECYPDRMLAPRFGRWSGPIGSLGFDFAPPSENGGHEGTVALHLTGTKGTFSVTGEGPFHFDARHCTVEDLKQAKHTHEIPVRPETVLHLDAMHMPIGGDMAWSTMMDPGEVPHGGTYTLNITLQ